MPRPPVILIAALSARRVIGSGDEMPWDVPEEYQNFLDLVRDQAIVMGRRSYQIFGPDLTTRYHYVLTRSNQTFDHATAVADLATGISQAQQHDVQVFIGGGESVYQEALPIADRMYLSYIRGEFEGDTYFPKFDPSDWQVVQRDDRGSYEFVEYHRR